MIAGIEIENGSRDPDHAPFRGELGFDTFYLCAKFDDSSLNRSRNIIRPQNLKCHVTLTTPLLRVICDQYVWTWRSLPVYKIWPL